MVEKYINSKEVTIWLRNVFKNNSKKQFLNFLYTKVYL